MPNYLICSTDKEDFGHILINLCPYFFEQQAKITVHCTVICSRLPSR
jgi:hypothetical protein